MYQRDNGDWELTQDDNIKEVFAMWDRQALVKSLTPDELAFHDAYEFEISKLSDGANFSLAQKIRAVQFMFKRNFTNFDRVVFNRKIVVNEDIIRKKISETTPMYNGFSIKISKLQFSVSTVDYRVFEVYDLQGKYHFNIEFSEPFNRPCMCEMCTDSQEED
ncbi:TPA: hypothetical protein QDB06_000781 [Burkholderia vietnamiensis]|nr:hypothetical protein [Burkholderia vietnamiensis]